MFLVLFFFSSKLSRRSTLGLSLDRFFSSAQSSLLSSPASLFLFWQPEARFPVALFSLYLSLGPFGVARRSFPVSVTSLAAAESPLLLCLFPLNPHG